MLEEETMGDILISASAGAPAITAFRNIQFIAAWSDAAATGINALPLSMDGGASGNTFLVNVATQTNPRRVWPAIVECGAGFVIAWIEFMLGDPNGNVKLRIFDADTFSPGDEIQVNAAPVDHNQPPALASLSDGGFIIAWADARADQRIRAQRFDRSGNRNGPDFHADTTAGLHRRPIITRLSGGNIVIGWLARSTAPLQARFQIFDATATPVGGERVLAGATMANVTALDDGRFVTAHVRNPADGEVLDKSIVQVSVFEPTGAAVGSATPVSTEEGILSDWPTLTPLPGGRFLVGWTQGPTAAGNNKPDVMATIFSDGQGPLGQTHKLNTTPGGVRFSLCAATAAGVGQGGTLLAVWGSQADDGTARGLFGTSVPIPAAGFP
jgi:hypothetical protein